MRGNRARVLRWVVALAGAAAVMPNPKPSMAWVCFDPSLAAPNQCFYQVLIPDSDLGPCPCQPPLPEAPEFTPFEIPEVP